MKHLVRRTRMRGWRVATTAVVATAFGSAIGSAAVAASGGEVVMAGQSTLPWGGKGGALLPITARADAHGLVTINAVYAAICPKTATRKFAFPTLNANVGIRTQSTPGKVKDTLVINAVGHDDVSTMSISGSLSVAKTEGRITIKYAETREGGCNATNVYDLFGTTEHTSSYSGSTSQGQLPVAVIGEVDNQRITKATVAVAVTTSCRSEAGKTYMHMTPLGIGHSLVARAIPVDAAGRFSDAGTYTSREHIEQSSASGPLDSISYSVSGRFSGNQVTGTASLRLTRRFYDGTGTDVCELARIPFTGRRGN